MKQKLIIETFFLLLTLSTFGNTWETIKEKTWKAEKEFPSNQIVFYETINGLKKAIYQMEGSGRCAVISLIYDVDINNDTVFLRNQMDLDVDFQIEKRKKSKTTSLILSSDNELISSNLDYKYKKLNEEAKICKWWIGNYCEERMISLSKLKSISIEKGSIYKLNSFACNPNPENCGKDDKSELTTTEALFLNEYFKKDCVSKHFNFVGKRILFTTGSGGGQIGRKSEYFDDIKEWKEKYNARIATSITILDNKNKEIYGYDAILTYWVKVFATPKSIKMQLEKAKAEIID
jgi:hypothetical protein